MNGRDEWKRRQVRLAPHLLWSTRRPVDRHRLPFRCHKNAIANGHDAIHQPVALLGLDCAARRCCGSLERVCSAAADDDPIFDDHVWNVPIIEAGGAAGRRIRRAVFVPMLLGWRCIRDCCDLGAQPLGAVARSSADALASAEWEQQRRRQWRRRQYRRQGSGANERYGVAQLAGAAATARAGGVHDARRKRAGQWGILRVE